MRPLNALRRTKWQLQQLTDYADFESFCDDLMTRCGYVNIEPLGKFQDKGRDAIHFSKATGEVTIFAYSVREDWEKKLKADLDKIMHNKIRCDNFVFVTTESPTTTQRDQWVERTKDDYGWALELYGLERVATLVDNAYSILKQLHPAIFPLEVGSTSTLDQSKNWIRILTFKQKTSLPAGAQMNREVLQNFVNGLGTINGQCLLLATAKAFTALPGIETVLLVSCFIEGNDMIWEFRGHRYVLLREIQSYLDLRRRDAETYAKAWQELISNWPNAICEISVPVGTKLFPLGISYNREARVIKLRWNLIDTSIHLPGTTDDFLIDIGKLAHAMNVNVTFGPPGHPLNKVLAYSMDRGGIDIDRIRVNANNVDEFDYVYEEYDEEIRENAKRRR